MMTNYSRSHHRTAGTSGGGPVAEVISDATIYHLTTGRRSTTSANFGAAFQLTVFKEGGPQAGNIAAGGASRDVAGFSSPFRQYRLGKFFKIARTIVARPTVGPHKRARNDVAADF